MTTEDKKQLLAEIQQRASKATDVVTEVLDYGNLITLRVPVPDFQLMNKGREDIPWLIAELKASWFREGILREYTKRLEILAYDPKDEKPHPICTKIEAMSEEEKGKV